MKSQSKTEQVNNPEMQAMNMARQTLGRIKEMNLKPEQNQKIMTMIDEAKAAEVAGNKFKALRIYQELMKFLQEIKTPKVEIEIEKIKVKDAINIQVNADQYIEDVLKRYRGYVVYDENKHDLSEVEIRTSEMTVGAPQYSYLIVKE
ncbi:MAG: hypothetical protein NT116_01305 [Candidatus Parcubacteria bacterium]|nr:hypothetical protein [Candidatus Parcubacteria bacterium]